jgi:hypothetical protein
MSRLLLTSVAVALVVVAPSPLTAQQSADAGTAVSRVAVTKARQHALTTIQGNALDSTNGHLSNTVVRLRDARFGRIVDTQLTDNSGLFTFRAIDPGSYIVEIMANDESILAASQILNVNPGEALSAVVKLPFRVPPMAGLLGAVTPSATAIAAEAAMSSIAAVVPTASISPNQ